MLGCRFVQPFAPAAYRWAFASDNFLKTHAIEVITIRPSPRAPSKKFLIQTPNGLRRKRVADQTQQTQNIKMIKPLLPNKNKGLHLCVRISVALHWLQLAFFSLANLGITNYVVFFGAISVFLSGMIATTLIQERIQADDLRGKEPSQSLARCAIYLPIGLLATFCLLLVLQFW